MKDHGPVFPRSDSPQRPTSGGYSLYQHRNYLCSRLLARTGTGVGYVAHAQVRKGVTAHSLVLQIPKIISFSPSYSSQAAAYPAWCLSSSSLNNLGDHPSIWHRYSSRIASFHQSQTSRPSSDAFYVVRRPRHLLFAPCDHSWQCPRHLLRRHRTYRLHWRW